MVLLERLSDARRNGHEVLAVLKGSAVNQDGASNGITAPNGPSQQRVIRQALAGSGLTTADVDVVEAHGTGTTLGDPIEAQSLMATYGKDRPTGRPLLLGSVKSNIGHTQAAAGVAGVIKMVLAIRHGIVPRTMHLDTPSSHVDWSAGEVELLTKAVHWPETGGPRRAAVSSFGISGTNAHTILEQAPAQKPVVRQPVTAGPVPVVVSGRTPEALRAQAARLSERIAMDESLDLADLVDLAFSAATTRSVFTHRAVVVADDYDGVVRGLRCLADGEPDAGVLLGEPRSAPATAFLFAGQGSQRWGMGRRLHDRHPVFAAAFDQALDLLDPALKDVLWGEDDGRLDRTEFAQPALFAIEVALFRLLESWGVRPDFVAGHSVGEIAAAHVAGVLTLADACTMVTARARLMQALPAGGAMVAVQASEDEVRPLLGEGVGVAAVNGPRSVVLSGTEDAVLAAAAGFEKSRRLPVSHAFHSPLMDPMLDDFRAVVAELAFAEPQLPVVASGEITTPEYWVRQVRDTVRFADAVERLSGDGVSAFVELGPDGALSASLDRPDATVIPLLRKDRDDTTALVTAVAGLHTAGIGIDWPAYFTGAGKVALPTYAFQREWFWPRPAAGGNATGLGLTATGHPLLGATVALADSAGVLFSGRLSLATHPWLADHVVGGRILFPGAAFLELAVRAGDEVGCAAVEELTLAVPLVLEPGEAVALQLVVGGSDEAGRRELTLSSRAENADAEWIRHATGVLAPDAPAADFAVETWPPADAAEVDLAEFYERFAEAGFRYGPVFQGLERVWHLGDEVFAEVGLPGSAQDADAFGLHPALLDAALQAISFVESVPGGLPFAWNTVSLLAGGATRLRVRISPVDGDTVALAMTDEAGQPVLSAEGITLRTAAAPAAEADPLFELSWVPVPGLDATVDATAGTWAVVGDAFGLAEAMGADVHPDLAACLAADPLPDVIAVPVAGDADAARSAHRLATAVLEQVQALAADERTTQVVFVTRGAMGPDVSDVAAAAVWGLVRTAQSENPGRFVLLDVDEPAAETLRAAMSSGEPQLRVRDGSLSAARLVRAAPQLKDGAGWNPDGTILITGGTGALGRLFARHVVAEHGARHVLLVSRRGGDAEGMTELAAELTALGAETDVAACDVADRAALAALLARIPADHPLTAVLHTAGVVDDGVLGSLSEERLATVFAPKLDAAWLLHELTGNLDAFVLFSSVAGTIGSAGQANYAAANAFLDALAQFRRAQGMPATSLAWGAWETGMTGALTDADRDRMVRAGMPPLAVTQGVEMFDRAVASSAAARVPMRVDLPVLRSHGELPWLLRPVARPGRRAAAGLAGRSTVDLRQQLAAMREPEQERALLALVRAQVAAVLGHPADRVDAGLEFRELGFDSLTAVEFRNRLGTATGLRLSATLVFDYPTPAGLAHHLRTELAPEPAGAVSLPAELDRLDAVVEASSAGELAKAEVAARLRQLLAKVGGTEVPAGEDVTDRIEAASTDEVLAFIDNELGRLTSTPWPGHPIEQEG